MAAGTRRARHGRRALAVAQRDRSRRARRTRTLRDVGCGAGAAMTTTMIPSADYIRILPELVFAIFGTLVMVLDPLLPERASRRPLGLLAAVGAVAALAATMFQMNYAGTAFFGMVRVDAFSIFFHLIIAIVSVLAIL